MKNLEIEYKKLTEENVPDLWDRIEAGIDKLEAEKIANSDDNIEKKDKVVNFTKKKTINRIVPIIVAAAAITLTLGLFMMSNSGVKSLESAMPVQYDAAPAAEAEAPAAAAEDIGFSDFAASDSINDAKAEEYEEAMPELMENAVAEEAYDNEATDNSRDKISLDVAKEATVDSVEYYGSITLCDNIEFIEITTEDGNIVKIYVPLEYRETIEEAGKEGQQLHISYEKIGDDIINSFPEDYKDTKYQIIDLKK